MNTNSPAYMLPNSRMPCETVLATYSMICIRHVDETRSRQQRICWNRRAQLTSSCAQPPSALDLDVVVQAQQAERKPTAQRGGQVSRGHDTHVGMVRIVAGQRQ